MRHRRGARAHAAIVGGTLTSIGEVPWQVAVLGEFEYEGEKYGLLCGGSIVELDRVVTAGHCTYNPGTGAALPAANLVVLAGASTITLAEIEHGASVQARLVSKVRRHPDFDYAEGAGTPDDVAVLTLSSSLKETSAVKPIALPQKQLFPPDGVDASVSGYGAENARASEINESLYKLQTTIQASSTCGGEAQADFLCTKSTAGTACNGDSGGPLTAEIEGSLTLIGAVDFGEGTQAEPCPKGGLDGFVNVTAPEIRDFVEGSESPPLAPRGGIVNLRGEPVVGNVLTCEPSGWRNAPSYSYAFINDTHRDVLQQGASPTYLLSEADLGRAISCELTASTAGGIAAAESATVAVQPAPSTTTTTTPTSATTATATTTSTSSTTTTATTSTATTSTAPPTATTITTSSSSSTSTTSTPTTSTTTTTSTASTTSATTTTTTSSIGGGASGGAGATHGQEGSISAQGNPLAPSSPLPTEAFSGEGRAALAASLRDELAPAGALARLTRVLRGSGYTMSVNASAPGTVVVSWYHVPRGATVSSKEKAKPLLVASGRATFPKASSMKVRIKLTAPGRLLLGRTHRVKLTAKGTFTPLGGQAIVVTKMFVLGR